MKKTLIVDILSIITILVSALSLACLSQNLPGLAVIFMIICFSFSIFNMEIETYWKKTSFLYHLISKIQKR